MRDSCIECIMKHIGQAVVLLHETTKGYAYHLVYVVGHLAEAEDESVKDFPELSDRIHLLRKSILKGESYDIESLAEDVYEMWRVNSE